MSLFDLMQDKRFEGLLLRKRSYSPELDALLEKHEKGSNLSRAALQAHHLIQQILVGRINYTIEYPFVSNFLEQIYGEGISVLGSIAISEINPYGFSHVACPKNAWGRQVVDDFDRMLVKLKPTPEYLKILEMWIVNEDEIAMIRKVYEADFLTNN